MESNYTLDCIVFGESAGEIFPIEIASTKTVHTLKCMIKEEKKHVFHDVDTNNLKLWKVKNLLIDGAVQDNLKRHLEEEESLLPISELSEVFTELPEKNRLHIVVRVSPTGPVATDIPPFLTRRALYINKPTGAPSELAHPAQLARLQAKKEYLCNRPRDAAGPVPVTLLEPIFAEFVDDCKNYQPTAADSQFVRELSEEMCGFYTQEPMRMHKFRELFLRHGIELHADTIGSSQ
ncbi:hypothetical protein AZE42_06901, partial [Rhizopogon vesiculosus]